MKLLFKPTTSTRKKPSELQQKVRKENFLIYQLKGMVTRLKFERTNTSNGIVQGTLSQGIMYLESAIDQTKTIQNVRRIKNENISKLS